MSSAMPTGRTHEDYYRHYLRLAEQASTAEERALFLQMAQSWNALSEQAETIKGLFAHVKPAGHA
jgi:hypothetical protein